MTTLGNYIDAISIVNIKIYFLENIKRNPNATDAEIADATRRTNILNTERNYIIDQIDIGLNKLAGGEKQTLYGANKMYGNE